MKKKIAIIVACAVVVGGMALALFLLNRDDGGTKISGDDPYADISTEICYLEETDISAVRAANFPDAPDYEVKVTYDDESDAIVCEMQNNPEEYYYSDTYMNLMVATLTDLEATSVAAAEGANLNDYGITDESITYTVVDGSGNEITMKLGAQTPLSSGYYFIRTDRDIVYIVDTYTGSTLERDMYEMRSVVIYPTVEDYYDLYRMRIEYADGSVVDSRQLSDEEVEEGSTYALFKFTEPLTININDDVAKNSYYDLALNLAVTDILADSKDDLAQYGLDTPDKIYFFNTDGDETQLWLGDYLDGETGLRYGTMPSVNCIFTVKGDYSFMTMDIYKLVDNTIWIHAIDDMKYITFTGEDFSFELYIDAFSNDDDSSDYRFYAEMDQVSMDEDSVRNMYVELVSFPTLGTLEELGLDADEIRQSSPDYTLDFVYDDNSEHYIRLYAINDMQYAADVDGNMLFYTSRSQLMRILRCFEMLRAGEIIEEL